MSGKFFVFVFNKKSKISLKIKNKNETTKVTGKSQRDIKYLLWVLIKKNTYQTFINFHDNHDDVE